jgi:hypothetical protein
MLKKCRGINKQRYVVYSVIKNNHMIKKGFLQKILINKIIATIKVALNY